MSLNLAIILFAEAATTLPPIRFDLRDVKIGNRPCSTGETQPRTEIVVCGKRRTNERVPTGGESVEELLLPKAEFGLIGKVRGKIAGQQGNVGGITTNRMMVTIAAPF